MRCAPFSGDAGTLACYFSREGEKRGEGVGGGGMGGEGLGHSILQGKNVVVDNNPESCRT